MNDYWHIPRASLSPSSASSAVSSASSTHRSNRSTTHTKQKLTPTHYRGQTQHQQLQQHHHHQQPQRHHNHNLATMQGNTSATSTAAVGGRTGGSRRDSNMSATKVTTVNTAVAAPKRGSRSSQGSNDSNNSTRSAASGSLLLTAANLERMTEIHRKQQQQHQKQHHNLQKLTQQQHHHLPESVDANAVTAFSATTYNANLMHAAATQQSGPMGVGVGVGVNYHGIKAITAAAAGHQDHADSIIDIDPNLDFVKTKDMDTVSIASSMHFTMVNGEAGTNKKTKKGLCDRGRQVTVLIISMSTIFLFLIMGMVYALEMRAREMPQS